MKDRIAKQKSKTNKINYLAANPYPFRALSAIAVIYIGRELIHSPSSILPKIHRRRRRLAGDHAGEKKMLSSTALRPLAQPATATATATAFSASRTAAAAGRRGSAAGVVVRAVRNYDSIPKREPFSSSRSVLDEFLRQEKPLVQRTKDQITGKAAGLCCCFSREPELSPHCLFSSNILGLFYCVGCGFLPRFRPLAV